jgi:hypothetical protein
VGVTVTVRGWDAIYALSIASSRVKEGVAEPVMTSQEDEAREKAKARNREWIMHHPLPALILYVVFAVGLIWFRFDFGERSHLSTDNFLLLLAIAVIVGVALVFYKIRSGNRRAQLKRPG